MSEVCAYPLVYPASPLSERLRPQPNVSPSPAQGGCAEAFEVIRWVMRDV
ncbi:MAG: hypothetical protein V1875_06840 [Candidatus Altiarchaeota archaeon]